MADREQSDDVDERIAEVSMALSTAENRVEYAGVELDSTRDAVGDTSETTLVGSRLTDLEDRMETLESEVKQLQADLQQQVGNGAGDSAERLAALDRIQSAANSLQGRADQLLADAEDVERLVADPTLVVGDLRADVDALEGFLSELGSTIADLTAVLEDDSTVDGDPAAVWFEATVRHRFRSLAIADVRAELEEIRDLSDRADPADVPEVEQRLDEVEDRWETLGDRLDDLAPAEWKEQYEDGIEDARTIASELEPPVDWERAADGLDEVLSRVSDQ